MSRYVFPPWTNRIRSVGVLLLVLGILYNTFLIGYAGSPKTTDVGYAPIQPVPFQHSLHAGELGLDCRYCHSTVERAAFAAIPTTEVCMNCHSMVRTTSPRLALVRESYATGLPMQWIKVHDLPEFVYFDHSAHVRRGVGCVSCHGRVDKMDVVQQAEPLSMSWCLDCHRFPERNLRPPEMATKMTWVPAEDPRALGKRLRETNQINPPTDCSTCHR